MEPRLTAPYSGHTRKVMYTCKEGGSLTKHAVSWFTSHDGEDEENEMTLRVDVFCESDDADKAKSHAQDLFNMVDMGLSDRVYDCTNEAQVKGTIVNGHGA